MSSQGFGSLERDVLRERERAARERALLLGKMQETCPPPIFSEPIKVDPSLEDETSKRVKSTLGDFHGILNTDPKNLIGISRSGLLAIHNSKSSSSSTGHSSSSKSKDASNDSTCKPNILNGQHKSSHLNTQDAEIKHLSSSTHQRNKDYTKTQNVDNNNKLKKKVQLSTGSSSSAVRSEPLDKNKSSSNRSKKSSAFQNVEKFPSDNLCEERLTGKAVAAPVKENVAVTEQVDKNDKQPQVESILEEMRLNIPPPLTAICSPGRDEPFHFPITEEPVIPFNTRESDHSAGVEQCTDSTNSLIMLREDLEVSESDEELGQDKLADPDILFNSTLESPDLNSLHPPPPVDAMSSSAKSSGESEMSEPEMPISVPSNESVKKTSKVAKVSRSSEKKHKGNRKRNDKEVSTGSKHEVASEKTDTTLSHDKGDRTRTKKSQEKEKSLSPLLSDLEMNLVHEAISEETLAVCPPIQPICVSPLSPVGHNSQQNGPSLSSQTEKSGKSTTAVHKSKTVKKKRSESNHNLDSHASLQPSGTDKVGTDPAALLPTNSAAVSCDGTKGDIEKSKRHKHKQEKRETKEKFSKSEENKKSHKRTNSSEKKTHELSSRSSTPKQLSKVEEEPKVPKGNDAQKRKANFHRPKSKKFILDSSDDSDSQDSDFDKPTREVASVAKNSGQKTSRNNVENTPINSSCLARPDDEQAARSHSEIKSKEALKRASTEPLPPKNIAVVTPIVLDKTTKELSFEKSVNLQLSLDKPLFTETPSLKPTKCQSQPHINESHLSTIPSFLVSINLKYIERLPKLKEHNKLCEKKETKAENNLNTVNDISHLSQTEEKVSKEVKRKHSEERKYKHKKLKVTPTASPKTMLPVKKDKPGDEFWDAKITPKSSERCDSPSSLCSFSSQQSHRSITHHGQGKSSDRGKKERKTKDSLSEQKLKGHTPSKESKLDEDRKHKPKKEKCDDTIKIKEKSRSGGKYQTFENSQEGVHSKSSQVYKAENAYRETTRQDECATVSHDDLAEWNNSNSSWLLPKQGVIECCDKYMNEAKKLKHEADMETDFRVQAMKYLDAVLCFILAGMAKEKSHCQASQTYTLYKETLDLIRYIASKFQKNAQSSSQNRSMDTKLYVLSLRCQSLLYLKLYRLRRGEVREIHKTLSKVQKQKPNHRPLQTTPVTTLSHQPSPGHLKGGMPSPHSPTPSPAGSVASVGSQSSGYSSSEVVNGAQCRNVNTDSIINNPLPSVPSGHQQPSQDHHDVVSVPHSTYNMLQRQSTHLGNLHLCHDLWEQADIHISHGNCKEFFKLLDSKCGRLTLHSTFPELVEYIRKGLGMLKEET